MLLVRATAPLAAALVLLSAPFARAESIAPSAAREAPGPLAAMADHPTPAHAPRVITEAEAAAEPATEPAVRPTLAWLVPQLVPSPEWWITSRGVRFGVRWQITPLLYSFGLNRRLSRLRGLVVEPLARHAGSIELFASPEYITRSPSFAENWAMRGGVRAYYPLVQRGEYLSCSLGGSMLYAQDHLGASYEAGLYSFFGVLGVQVTVTPTAALRSTTITLSIRYF